MFLLTLPCPALADTPENRACLECHDGSKVIEVPNTSAYAQAGEKRALTPLSQAPYGRSVHSRMRCTECHTRITNPKPPHQVGKPDTIDCAACHESLAQSSPQPTPATLNVLSHIKNYQHSIHARANRDHPDFLNATCNDCHDSHTFTLVPQDKTSPELATWKATIPEMCGKCHEDELEDYSASVHSFEFYKKKNAKSAVCTDCHTSHGDTGGGVIFKLQSIAKCAACHEPQLNTYRNTYHGQIARLGYGHTAKCFDCHARHLTLPVKDAKSLTHPNNRLKTCQKCHDGQHRPLATSGFASFTPHAMAHDFNRHPQVWIASRIMEGLLWGVLGFFWLHACLWFYREWRERKHSQSELRVDLAALGIDPTRHVRRFSLLWRVTHLLFALLVMILIVTGMTLLKSESGWAAVLIRFLGGPENLALIHRVAAVGLLDLFLIHLFYLLQRLLRDRHFKWLGPDSLLPNRKDWMDCRDMFKWFVGMGPKPRFERWTYFEKFDYWAVFWGMTVMGTSGLVMAFPHLAGTYLEGWVFNVAILVHGQEALLAVLFLFTVHFFNNHFRPAKLPPPEIVMFTGTQSLTDFQQDHPAHFERLLASGELEHYLVKAPSRIMTLGSKLLGVLLIMIGMALLILTTSTACSFV
ncbi:MAG: cytochrome b/b6 domain-containing protein [Magnetococcus sp. YQC-5]